jgi:hypothetical protein
VRRVAFAALALLAPLLLGAWIALPTLAGPAQVQAGTVQGADLAVEDPDLTPLVGLVKAPSFFGLPVGQAPRSVFAVPSHAPEDLGAMSPTGRAFAFTDPHGNAWEVVEYEAPWGIAYGTALGPVSEDATAGAYNFVLLVDGSKVGGSVRVVAK